MEVIISKENSEYVGKIVLPNGEVSMIRSEKFEEILDHIANELEDRFGLL